MFAVRRDPQAFSLDKSSRKTRRIEDPAHLSFIRKLPCCVTGSSYTVEAAHIRAGSAVHRKKHTGLQQKPDDCWTLPLCAPSHREQHQGDELAFWRKHEIDPFELAVRLYEISGDVDAGRRIIGAILNVRQNVLWPVGRSTSD
jgi:hypothetical protein